jgi:hypothetical protein
MLKINFVGAQPAMMDAICVNKANVSDDDLSKNETSKQI